jgi:hypothetical protein
MVAAFSSSLLLLHVMMLCAIVVLALMPLATMGFAGPSSSFGTRMNPPNQKSGAASSTRQWLAVPGGPEAAAAESTTSMSTVTLTKPLGLILEEVQEGLPMGVFVKEVAETGSAYVMADALQGRTITSVMGTDCSSLDFDAVMELIRNTSGDAVTLTFAPLTAAGPAAAVTTLPPPQLKEYAVGTVVTIRVVQQQQGKDDLVFDAKVGDNLRQALLTNGFEVYQGMRQKLGNCGYVIIYFVFLFALFRRCCWIAE